MSPTLIYTVGHSNRSAEALMALLGEAGVEVLVDIRAQPRSRRQPQFDSDALRLAAEQAGMVYHWAGRQLGGHRSARTDSPHRALAEDGLRGYADHMDSETFQGGAAQLIRLAGQSPTAVLSAERSPDECHRSLLADYLTLGNAQVVHLIDTGVRREHMLRSEVRRESAQLIYDRQCSGDLDLQ